MTLIALFLYAAGFAIVLDMASEYIDHKPLVILIAALWPSLVFVMAWEIYKQRNAK